MRIYVIAEALSPAEMSIFCICSSVCVTRGGFFGFDAIGTRANRQHPVFLTVLFWLAQHLKGYAGGGQDLCGHFDSSLRPPACC